VYEDYPKKVGRITFEFDPDVDSEIEDMIQLLQGRKWNRVVWEFDRHLHSLVKYRDYYSELEKELPDTPKEVLEKMSEKMYTLAENTRQRLWDLLSDENLDLD
jgi:hypothetical protein